MKMPEKLTKLNEVRAPAPKPEPLIIPKTKNDKENENTYTIDECNSQSKDMLTSK